MKLVEQDLDSAFHPSHACLKFSNILSAWKPKGFWRKFYFSLCNCYCYFFDCLCCGYKHTRIYTPIHAHRHTEGDTFHCKRQSTLRKIVWSASHFVDIFLLVCCDALKFYKCVSHSVCVPLDVCVTLCIYLFLALFLHYSRNAALNFTILDGEGNETQKTKVAFLKCIFRSTFKFKQIFLGQNIIYVKYNRFLMEIYLVLL